MTVGSLKLDYYSGFEGETEIRFYTHSSKVVFTKNIQEYEGGKFQEVQLKQGENNIYFFSLWNGYFVSFLETLMSYEKDYGKLPNFIKNWNELKGWADINYHIEIISDNDLNWLIEKISVVTQQYEQSSQKITCDSDCFHDLLKFLEFVKDNKWELKICEE
jgi:hypothetical protein